MLKFLVFLSVFVVGVLCQSNDPTDYYDNQQQPINNQQTHQKPSSQLLPCRKGWRYISEYSKCLYATPSLTWHEAEKYCTDLGAHLMTIHAQNEVQPAQDMVGGDFWIGLYKSVNSKEYTWRFTNNETLDYIPWGSTGSSECAFGNGRNVHQNHGCDSKHSGICQLYAYS
uniref:C-type lectin domain-containing protein n=1 Tax=Panagrolaimus davidi TaxID=227884 RepID=A0A914QN33_9BILA